MSKMTTADSLIARANELLEVRNPGETLCAEVESLAIAVAEALEQLKKDQPKYLRTR